MPRHSQRFAVVPNADKVTVQLANAEELKPKVVEVRTTLCSCAPSACMVRAASVCLTGTMRAARRLRRLDSR